MGNGSYPPNTLSDLYSKFMANKNNSVTNQSIRFYSAYKKTTTTTTEFEQTLSAMANIPNKHYCARPHSSRKIEKDEKRRRIRANPVATRRRVAKNNKKE